jgi:mannan endo-1,4-beta-mannosidase
LYNYLTRLIFLFLGFILVAQPVKSQQRFVKVQGGRLMLGSKPYVFVGTNYWYGVLLPAVNGNAGKIRLKRELDFLKAKGVNNLRVFAGADGQTNNPFRVPYAIQPQQGVINEHYLKSLDYFLDEAGKRGFKVVLFLTNNWDWSGGLTQYLAWNGFSNTPASEGYGSPNTTDGKNWWDEVRRYTAQFYDCSSCKTGLDNFIKKIIGHKNLVNGKKYTDDATIMAWEIANEPRPMMMDKLPAFQKWISHVAAVIKIADKNHLVTTGSEGDIAYDNSLSAYTITHQDKNIDYLTIHIWPKNWRWFKDTAIVKSFPDIIKSTRAYVDRHVKVARALNKPMVIEEFGLPRDQHLFAKTSTTASRDRYYQYLLTQLLQSSSNKGAISGINFWGMGGFAANDPAGRIWKPGDDLTCDPGQEKQGLNAVFATDASTWKVITQTTALLPKQ